MRIIKKYIVLSALLLFYMAAVSLLLAQFCMYQRAYYALSRQISHSSIEIALEEIQLQEE